MPSLCFREGPSEPLSPLRPCPSSLTKGPSLTMVVANGGTGVRAGPVVGIRIVQGKSDVLGGQVASLCLSEEINSRGQG